jgi:hypothetical protein
LLTSWARRARRPIPIAETAPFLGAGSKTGLKSRPLSNWLMIEISPSRSGSRCRARKR